MKFDVTLKTKDELFVEAEFKWRPKDFTLFKTQLKLSKLNTKALIDFKSPFSPDFIFTVVYDFTSDVKSMDIYYKLIDVVHLKAIVIPSGDEQKINITLSSPIAGYKLISLTGLHTIRQKSHNFDLVFTRENTKSQIQINVNSNDIKVILSSDKIRWLLNGNYNLEEGTHKVNIAFQWGGVSDVIKTEILYKASSMFLFNFDGPLTNYKVDLKSEWNDERKGIDLFLKRNEMTAEIKAQLETREHLHMFFAHIKSPFVDYLRVSSFLDAESKKMRGVLQVNETVYSISASNLDDNKYAVVLNNDEKEDINLEVSYEGDISSGLKIDIICKSQEVSNFKIGGILTYTDVKKFVSMDISWNENSNESISLSYLLMNNATEILTEINIGRLPDFASFVAYGDNFVTLNLRNQSESFKGRVDYFLTSSYSVNTTFEYNEELYKIFTFLDLNDVSASTKILWPENQEITFSIVLRPGDLSINLATPFVNFNNIQFSGKYSESSSGNMYQISSVANAVWDIYAISIEGNVRNSKDHYGITGTMTWGNENAITLICDVIKSKTLLFNLLTPFKGLPYISAKLEALQYRHVTTGIHGEITTPFIKLPQINFTFNRADNIIEAFFSFDTSTYKNISIGTKFATQNNKYLFLHINAPFLNQVKQIKIDAKSEPISRKGSNTKIVVYLDDKEYEMRNNYTITNGKLDSKIYLRGPTSKPIEFRFGGKFIMNSFSDIDIETFLNEDTVAVKYSYLSSFSIGGKIYLPSSKLWKTPSEFELTLTKNPFFEGKLNYNYGGLVGNALVKNKLFDGTLETIMYLNLPRILKHPLQFELNANYIHPRLQFSGYASFMAEHRLDLTMEQNSFRTTLDAHLNSAFFKGTKKFNLALTSDTLSIAMNDEIRVTGVKKRNELILTLNQLHNDQVHTLTYNWQLINVPKFEVILESPILTAKKATFSATYLGITQGVSLKLVSGSESMKLDYSLLDQKFSKGIKVLLGNANTQFLSFTAVLNKITNGHDIIADLNVLELHYKARFNYTLPVSDEDPLLTADLNLDTPYLFPMKILRTTFSAGRKNQKYLLQVGINIHEEILKLKSELTNDSLSIIFESSFDYMTSGRLEAKYKIIDEKNIIDGKLFVNGDEILIANASLLYRPHSVILECHSKAKLPRFSEFHMKITIPSELKYSLIANIELEGTEPFKAYFILTSRPAYTNLDLVMTGLTANIHLTSNQGDFSFKTGSDDYHMRIYSKSSGHELHSELTVNSGSIELLKAGLFGMYHNQSDFYIQMSTTLVYEPIQNVVFYVGAEKSKIRFGAEYEGSIVPSKQSYTAIINHHVESLIDFDLGLVVENHDTEIFTAKLTHNLKSDFYVALARINKSMFKITIIDLNQIILSHTEPIDNHSNDTLRGTLTIKHNDFSAEMSVKLISKEQRSKGLDIKLTLNNVFYQIGGLYDINSEYFKINFDIDSPYTNQNSLAVFIQQSNKLFVSVTRDHTDLFITDLKDMDVRSKYILLNLTDVKFMLNESTLDDAYELSSTLLFRGSTYRAEVNASRENVDSYKCNATIIFPTRTVSIYKEKVKSEFRNAKQLYISWENINNKLGYSFDVYKDNFKTNVKLNLEIPQRAIEFKTHKRYMIIDDYLEDIEYGIQFNWNTKIHTKPVTYVSSLKYNKNVAYLYLVFAHPTFNSTFAIDCELRRPVHGEIHMASKIGTLYEGVLTPIISTALNTTVTESSRQYSVLIMHPESNLHQAWYFKMDSKDGLFAKMTLVDGINNKHATGALTYVSATSRLDMSVTCQDLEIKLGGQLDVDPVNGRIGVFASGSYDPLSDPLTLSAVYEVLDVERIRVTAELSVAAERSYFAEARYTPTHVSARVIHREYSATLTAIHASVTLNNSETLSVSGRYRPELWSNLTQDLTVPAERAALVARKLAVSLREMMNEEVFIRMSSISVSQIVGTVYRRVVDHTKSEWSAVQRDLDAFVQRVVTMYGRDEFYMRTIYDHVVDAIWQGKVIVGEAMLRVRMLIQTLLQFVIPELIIDVYRATVEPIIVGLQKLAPSVTRFVRRIADAWRKVQTAVSATYRTTVGYVRDAAIATTKYTTDNAQSLNNWVAETKEMIENDVLEPTLNYTGELASAIKDWINEVDEFLSSIPDQVIQYCMSLEETQAIINVYKQYASWLEEIRFAEIVTSLREAFRQWYAELLQDLRVRLGPYSKHLLLGLEMMQRNFDEFMTLPPVVYLRTIQARINQKITWFWNYWELEATLQEAIIQVGDMVIELVRNWAEETVDDYQQSSVFSDDVKLSYSPDTGDFEGTFSLPFMWRRFDSVPRFDDDVKEKFSNFRYAVMDKMYHLASESSDWKDTVVRTLLPPFSSNALVTVNGHVITFDGNHYKIKDQLCGTYLLAADYYDDKFSVTVNYGASPQDLASPGPLRSLTLHTSTGRRLDLILDSTARIRGDEDGFSKILVDNVKTELPTSLDGFSVTREAQMVSAVGEDGVALRCNVVAGLCSLELPGWYHGRVAGLAGSLDREFSNDVASPQGDSLATISDFLKHWKVSKGTSCSIPVKNKGREPKVRSSSTCKNFFGAIDSPLQPCFARLDPVPFQIMCDQDAALAAQNRADDEVRAPECLAAEAYIEQCKFVDMQLSMPADCVKCMLPSGRSISAGETVIYDSGPGSQLPPPPLLADFVILLERGWKNGNCLQGRDLADLPAKLESVLRASLINSTRFALVTFGAGLEPSIHTVEGLIWSGRRSMQQALNSLELEPTDDKASDRDLLTALLVASSKLSFRAGASKSIVLAPCTSCGRSEETANVFAEASSLLLESDMRLHVLQKDDVPFRRIKKKQPVNQGSLNPVMGVDSHGAYTGRRVKGTSIPLPSKAIMRQLSIPKDLCTPLALETNGTMFSASRLVRREDEQQDAKRKWLDVWSRRVASSAKPSPCQTCDCLPYSDGSSRVTCQLCVSRAIQHFLQEWEDFLAADAAEDLEESDDDVSMSAETLDALNTRLQEEEESELMVINRIRDMIIHGKSIPAGL